MPCSICKKVGHNKRTHHKYVVNEETIDEKTRDEKTKEKKTKEKKTKDVKTKEKKTKDVKTREKKTKDEKTRETKEATKVCLENECSICLEVIKTGTELKTPCNHTFHKECLTQNFNHSLNCPLCRSDIEKILPEKIKKYTILKQASVIVDTIMNMNNANTQEASILLEHCQKVKTLIQSLSNGINEEMDTTKLNSINNEIRLSIKELRQHVEETLRDVITQ